MFPFPRQSVRFTFSEKLPDPDAFGNDVYVTSQETVNGVLVDQQATSDRAEPHLNHDNLIVTMDLPKTYNRSIKGATFEPLTGPLTGRLFKVEGDPVGLAYSPLPWNRSVIGVEFYRG